MMCIFAGSSTQSFVLDLKNAVIWMVSILPLISSPFSLFHVPWERFHGYQLKFTPPLLSCSVAFSALRQYSGI